MEQRRHKSRIRRWAAMLVGGLAALPTARAEVDLDWISLAQSSRSGELVLVELHAAATGLDQAIAGLDVIISWDADHLLFEGFIDPCLGPPCPAGTYDWLQSNFPNDSQLDGLNVDLTDGDALYQALSQLGRDNAAVATQQGLHVMTLVFRSAAPGSAEVRFETALGSTTRTRVLSGDFTGEEVTGALGPPAAINIAACPEPDVTAIGSRYLLVEPFGDAQPMALLVTGDENSSDIACVAAYVQSNGALGPEPVFRTASEWGAVSVHGMDIRPGELYFVQADCGTAGQPALSSPISDRTWLWGDANGDDAVGFGDVTRVVDAANGSFPGGTVLENVDLAPCAPDGVVNTVDISAALDALAQTAFPCRVPCVQLTWDTVGEFAQCLSGPTAAVGAGCLDYDFNRDARCDLVDFAQAQRDFAGE